MTKLTRRYTKELGKTRRQIKRETADKEARKDPFRDYPKHRSNGNGLKKNMRHKQPIEFQVCSAKSLKFCKRIALTQELKKLLGRGIMKIIPKEVRQHPEMIPFISVYRDTKNNKLILSIDSVEHEETLVTDENGNAELKPDFKYSQARYKHSA